MSQVLWTPPKDRFAASALSKLMASLADAYGAPRDNDIAFHRWTVEHLELFWRHAWDDCGVIGEPGSSVVEGPELMPGARWFSGSKINYAENLLRPRDNSEEAIIFRREDGFMEKLTYAELCQQVSSFAQALRGAGVISGDRVAAYLPNCPAAIVAMLATASIGAIFSSASPDFGVQGVLDRFGQITPKVLIAANGYVYNGSVHDRYRNISGIVAALPSVTKLFLVQFVDAKAVNDFDVDTEEWSSALYRCKPEPLCFHRVSFDHPLLIMYSSGTTGAPKCIVHGHGGTLLQHLKEHRYHLDLRPNDRVFYFTTLGWMMWNWLASALASKATLCLYDGSPAYPNATTLFDYAETERISFFGTSAKFIDFLRTERVRPAESHKLGQLRTIGSTGSPLSSESFDFVYDSIKADVHLASIAGGTDIVGCFMGGNPRLPVRRGEIQGPALAMDVAVFSPNGERIVGKAGELVCANTFPSMPVGFWDDADGKRYHAAYFQEFTDVWTHGDWVEQTASGGFIIYGRSDATLNPGGVRIGTAEIYRVVENVCGVEEAVVIGQEWNNDVRVVLFVRLAIGSALDGAMVKKIKALIRNECSPRHVPAKILVVTDIPRTRSGKISELAVRDIVQGHEIRNTEALANPECLSQYRHRHELED